MGESKPLKKHLALRRETVHLLLLDLIDSVMGQLSHLSALENQEIYGGKRGLPTPFWTQWGRIP